MATVEQSLKEIDGKLEIYSGDTPRILEKKSLKATEGFRKQNRGDIN